MKTTKRCVTLVFMILLTANASAQLKETMKNIFLGDTTIVEPITIPKKDSDSIKLSLMQKMLDEMRLSEADTRMEMELMKLQMAGVDSTKIAEQQHRIDSLKQFTKGVPVVVEKDTLFYLFTKRGGIMPKQRAQITAAAIEKLGKRFNLTPDSVYIDTSDIVSDVMYDNKVLVSFTDQDALWAGVSRDSLATAKRDIIVSKLFQLKAEHSFWKMIERIVYLILVIVGQVVLFRLTNWLFRKAKLRIVHLKFTKKLKPLFFHDYELLDTRKQVTLLVFLAGTTRYVLMALQLLITVPLIFIIFPQTEGLAFKLLEYIWNPIEGILIGVIEYIPKLFTIIIIWYAVKSLVRLIHYLSKEVENGRLKIRGFFPDWALPTYHIIRFLLYAFMIAMIYPYLPGSKSGVFQGVSVFVGIIVSLGSSTVIGNIIAGMVITYMRPFKIGDRIKLNDTEGKLIEKTPLVARIRTSKNEIVTVPNSFIMSSHTVNFSTSALESGLIIHTEVAMGYEVPWKQVKKILIQAARNTPGVLGDPAPFVLQTSLDDWYPIYQINAYIKDVDQMAPIYSDLFQNIQDGFMDAGIEMLSPHYMAIRDGNTSTIPKENLKAQEAKKAEEPKKGRETKKAREVKKPQEVKKPREANNEQQPKKTQTAKKTKASKSSSKPKEE